MNKIVKYALVGLAGYLIGFYEVKYKFAKALLDVSLKKEEVKQEEENEVQQ